MMFSTPEQFVVLAIVLIAGYLLGFASRPGTRKWKNRLRTQAERFTAYHDDAEDRVRAARQRAAALEAEAAALRADHEEAERTIAALKVQVPERRPSLALVGAPAPVHAEPVETTAMEDRASEPDAIAEHAVSVAPPMPGEPGEHASAAPVALSAARPAFGVDLAPVADPVAPPPAPNPTDAAPAPIGPAEPEMPAKGWFGSSTRDDLTRVRGIDGMLDTRLFGLGVLRFEDLEQLSAEDELALEERLALPAGYIAREQWRAQAALLRAGKDDAHAERFGPVDAPVEA